MTERERERERENQACARPRRLARLTAASLLGIGVLAISEAYSQEPTLRIQLCKFVGSPGCTRPEGGGLAINQSDLFFLR